MGASAQSIDLTEGMVVESEKFDLVIIGCGPAGEKAGAQAAYFGKRVAVIERAGAPVESCINTGTVRARRCVNRRFIFPGWGSAALRNRLFAERKFGNSWTSCTTSGKWWRWSGGAS